MVEMPLGHGYEMSAGTLYPSVHSLVWAAYPARDDRVGGGKVPEYYAIADDSRRVLDEARAGIGELVADVIERRDPIILPAYNVPGDDG